MDGGILGSTTGLRPRVGLTTRGDWRRGRMIWGWLKLSAGLIQRFLERVTLAVEHLFKHITEIFHEMKAISNLLRLGRTAPTTIGIGPAPITAHDLDPRMVA